MAYDTTGGLYTASESEIREKKDITKDVNQAKSLGANSLESKRIVEQRLDALIGLHASKVFRLTEIKADLYQFNIRQFDVIDRLINVL
jgi:hypothetical protein